MLLTQESVVELMQSPMLHDNNPIDNNDNDNDNNDNYNSTGPCHDGNNSNGVWVAAKSPSKQQIKLNSPNHRPSPLCSVAVACRHSGDDVSGAGSVHMIVEGPSAVSGLG